jgi:hypothetical protein
MPHSAEHLHPQLIADLFNGSGLLPKTVNHNLIKSTSVLHPLETKMSSLDTLVKTIGSEKDREKPTFVREILKNSNKMDDLFGGLKTCLNTP